MNPYEMAEQLNGKYREVFDKVTMYGVYNGIEKEEYEDRLMNLFDSLLEAQQEEKPIEKIIGKDIEAFCKEYFKDDETEKWWIKRLRALYKIMFALFICFGLDTIFPLSEGADIFSVKSDIAPFFVFFITGFIMDSILSAIMKPLIFKKKIKSSLYSGIIFFIWIACIMGCILFLEINDFKIEIPAFGLCIISGIYVLVYFVVRSIWRYKRYGRITKYDREEKQAKKEFNQDVSVKALENTSATNMAKRYKRLNEKRIKKGLPAMTHQEFADKVRKEDALANKYDKLVILAFAAMVIVPSVHEIITNSVVDGLILGVILCVIEFAIYRFFAKANKDAEISRKNVLDQCEEKGITIVEYAERL